AEELNDAGTGVFQIVPNTGYVPYVDQLPLMERIAKTANRPLTYTHAQLANWREALELLEESNDKPGVNIKAQLLPRPVGMMLGRTAGAHRRGMTRGLLATRGRPVEEGVAERRKPERRRATPTEEPLNPTNPLAGFVRRYDRMFLTGNRINYEPSPSRSVEA